MNKKGLSEISWLVILLVTFIIINKVSIWVNGSTLEATNQWISIILQSLIEALLGWALVWALKKSK